MTFFVIFGEICPKRVLIHFRRFEKCQKWSFLMKKGRKSAKNVKNDGFGTFEKVRGNDWGTPFCRKMHHKYHFLKKFLPHWAFGTFSNIWGQKWPQIDPLRPPFLTPFLRPNFGPLSKKSKFRYALGSDPLKTPSKNGPKRAILGSKLGDTFCPQKVVSKND